MNTRRWLAFSFSPVLAGAVLLAAHAVSAQTQQQTTAPVTETIPAAIPTPTVRHPRRYKAPPVTTHIEVMVLKATSGKPLMNAAVIFHATKDGKDQGNMEMKTDPEGKAVLELIPLGSTVQIQVIANGYATFGENYDLPDINKQIVIKLGKPGEQYSAYRESNSQLSDIKPGVQEPAWMKPQAATSALPANSKPSGTTTPTSAPASTPPAATPQNKPNN